MISFPQGEISDRMSLHACPPLGDLDSQVIGWEAWEQQGWYWEHDGLRILQVARRVRRIPPQIINERMAQEMQAAHTPLNAYEKKQLKQRIIDSIAPLIIPEKVLTTVMLDSTNDQIIIGSQSENIIDKILRLLQDTFSGVVIKPRWSKDAQKHAIKVSWPRDTWPKGSHPLGDVMLVHASAHHQRIRLSGVNEFEVIDDCIARGYIITGLRLQHTSGLSCFITPKGHFQSIRYPEHDEDDAPSVSASVDWLELLELRAWAVGCVEWIYENQ